MNGLDYLKKLFEERQSSARRTVYRNVCGLCHAEWDSDTVAIACPACLEAAKAGGRALAGQSTQLASDAQLAHNAYAHWNQWKAQQIQNFGGALGGLGSNVIGGASGNSGNSGQWAGYGTAYYPSITSTGPAAPDPQPRTYPEESAAVAGFAAGIKHALNRVLGGNGDDPEKQRLYEEVMASAVKMVLAPEGSELLGRMALLRHGRWVKMIDVGEEKPEAITLDSCFYRRVADSKSPVAVYEVDK